MSNYILTSNGELYHAGVKGMKWGVRRAEKKSARKAAREAREAELTPEQRKKRSNIKKGVAIGAAAAGTALAVFGAYKLNKAINDTAYKKASELGKAACKKYERDTVASINAQIRKKLGNNYAYEVKDAKMSPSEVNQVINGIYNRFSYGDKVRYYANYLKGWR